MLPCVHWSRRWTGVRTGQKFGRPRAALRSAKNSNDAQQRRSRGPDSARPASPGTEVIAPAVQSPTNHRQLAAAAPASSVRSTKGFARRFGRSLDLHPVVSLTQRGLDGLCILAGSASEWDGAKRPSGSRSTLNAGAEDAALGSTESSSREHNRKDQARCLRARLLRVPNEKSGMSGGRGGIRTRGGENHAGFQDRCIKPDSATLPAPQS